MNAPLRILADDLSGAADCAASFTGGFGAVPLYLDGAVAGGDRFAWDLDSRALDAASAARRWHAAALAHLADAPPGTILFKKIDSTLRGHVAAELAAILEAAPGLRTVVLTPAFPAQGRAFVDGKLRIKGAEPAAHSSLHDELAATLGAHCDVAPLTLAQLHEGGGGAWRDLPPRPRIVMADAADESDLAALVAMARRWIAPTLWVGSAGLARALAGSPPNRISIPALSGPALVVVGSFSAVSHAQVATFASASPSCVVPVPPHAARTQLVDVACKVSQRLARGEDALVHLASAEAPSQGTRHHVDSLAAALVPCARACATLVMTGGDTARALLGALGNDGLLVEGELEPGIAVTAPLRGTGTRAVLKAGGFGDNDLFIRITRSLSRMPSAFPSP